MLVQMTPNKWDQSSQRFLFSFKTIFECSGLFLSAVRSSEADTNRAVAVQGPENYERRTYSLLKTNI